MMDFYFMLSLKSKINKFKVAVLQLVRKGHGHQAIDSLV